MLARLARAIQRLGSSAAIAAAPAARPLLTPREAAFWPLLRAAAAPLHVAPQVAMGALLARPDRRIVDFVLVDDDGTVRLLVELDDRLHNRRRDAARDRDTAAAGYRTLRVEGVIGRDAALLTAAIDDALGRPRRWMPPALQPSRRAASRAK